MKSQRAPQWYFLGPHSRDYFLLLDEQSDHIFEIRLAEHLRDAPKICDDRADRATGGLLEMWIDDSENVWYLFEAGCSDEQ
jgi:hypothetical protein